MNVNGSTYQPGVITTKVNGKALIPGKIFSAGNTSIEPGVIHSTGSKIQTPGIKSAGAKQENLGFISTGTKQQAGILMSQQEGNKLKDADKDNSKLPMNDGLPKDGPKFTENETQADTPAINVAHKESSGGVIPPPASQLPLTDDQKKTARAFGMSDAEACAALADVGAAALAPAVTASGVAGADAKHKDVIAAHHVSK